MTLAKVHKDRMARVEANARTLREQTQEAAPTAHTFGQHLAAVQVVEQRAARLEHQATDLRSQIETLGQQIASAFAAGEPANALLNEKVKAQAELTGIEEALPLLRSQIAEGKEQALRAEAQARITELYNGTCTEVEDLEEHEALIVTLARKLRDAIAARAAMSAQCAAAALEVNVLASRFGLEAPEMPSTLSPHLVSALVDALKGLTLPEVNTTPLDIRHELTIEAEGEDRVKIKSVLGKRYLSGTPGAKLLAQGGKWSPQVKQAPAREASALPPGAMHDVAEQMAERGIGHFGTRDG